jgi:hypothetical protein
VFDPPGNCKSQGVPLAYSRLSVLTLPALMLAVNVPLLDVTSPFASITLEATSPTEKPAIELNALIAILLCPYIIFIFFVF